MQDEVLVGVHRVRAGRVADDPVAHLRRSWALGNDYSCRGHSSGETMSRTIASGLVALAISGVGVIALAAPASAACTVNYSGARCIGAQDSQSTQTPAPGGSITLDFTGLKPGSSLTLTLDTGQGFGTFTVNANGEVVATIQVPCNLSGPHTLTAHATNADGSAVTFTNSFTATACSSAGAGAGSSGSGSNLPFTGASTAAEGAVGLGLLAAGTFAVVVGRRRRTAVR